MNAVLTCETPCFGNWKLERDHIVSHVMAKDSSNFAIFLSGRNINSHLIMLFNRGVCRRDKRLQKVWTSVQNVFSHCIKAETEIKKEEKIEREWVTKWIKQSSCTACAGNCNELKSFCRMWLRRMVVVLLLFCLKGKNVISLYLLIAVCTEKKTRELYFIGCLMTSVA